MNSQYKHRLVGAAVLVAFGVIVIPMVLDGSGQGRDHSVKIEIPESPRIDVPPLTELTALEPVAKPIPDEDTEASLSLPPSEIAPPVPNTEPPQPDLTQSPTAWVVQVGSFISQTNALALRDQLRTEQFAAFVQKQGIQYKVWIGPETDRRLADQLQTRLAKEKGYQAMVLQYP